MAYLLFNLSIIYTIVCFVMLLKILFKHDWSKKGPARGMFQFFRASTFLFLGMAYIFRYFAVPPKTEAQLWQEYKIANKCHVVSVDDSSFFRSAKVAYQCATGKTIVKRESNPIQPNY